MTEHDREGDDFMAAITEGDIAETQTTTQTESPGGHVSIDIAEAIEHNKQFADEDMVEVSGRFPIIKESATAPYVRNAQGATALVEDIIEYCDSLDEDGGAAQTFDIPSALHNFGVLCTEDELSGPAPDPNDPAWDGYHTEVWFGYGDDEIEVLLTYHRPEGVQS